jgi:hypothetical protein
VGARAQAVVDNHSELGIYSAYNQVQCGISPQVFKFQSFAFFHYSNGFQRQIFKALEPFLSNESYEDVKQV